MKFLPISEAPRNGSLCIVSGPSGYASTPRYFRSAYWDIERGGWLTESHDRLEESHQPPDSFVHRFMLEVPDFSKSREATAAQAREQAERQRNTHPGSLDPEPPHWFYGERG